MLSLPMRVTQLIGLNLLLSLCDGFPGFKGEEDVIISVPRFSLFHGGRLNSAKAMG